MEIGGYLELENFRLPMRHDGSVALNCGRNCLAYLIEKKNIKKIYIPKFLCASVGDICKKCGAEVIYYSIGMDFLPLFSFELVNGAWLYVVNYYGQISNAQLMKIKQRYQNVIVDNVQAYFQDPCKGVDTIYSCRKFFGVSDGAFLYSDIEGDEALEIDCSFERMAHILGRYEKTASEFFPKYKRVEKEFEDMPIKRMSKLTDNILRGLDYCSIERTRTENFRFLHDKLAAENLLDIEVPPGPYMYPLYVKNGYKIRKKLQEAKIFVATLWPDALELCSDDELEYDMAKNILPLPVDQRYGISEMEILAMETLKNIRKGDMSYSVE